MQILCLSIGTKDEKWLNLTPLARECFLPAEQVNGCAYFMLNYIAESCNLGQSTTCDAAASCCCHEQRSLLAGIFGAL